MRRWSVRLMFGLAAVCTLTPMLSVGQTTATTPYTRRAHGTGTPTYKVSGRRSTRLRGTSRTMARASAFRPDTASWKGGHPVSAGSAREEEAELRTARDARPGNQVLSAWRSPHHLHAVSVSNHSAGR